MRRLCIIPCGKKKIWDKYPADYGPMEAKDVYISPFGKACQAYATMFFENCYIIGEAWILRPNDIVLENYDLAFDSKSDEIISMEQLKQQMIEKDLLQFDEIVLLAGKKHKKVV